MLVSADGRLPYFDAGENKMEIIGTIKSGESKEFLCEIPPGLQPGDKFGIKIEWECPVRHHWRKFVAVVGEAPPVYEFGCFCKVGFFRNLISKWLRR